MDLGRTTTVEPPETDRPPKMRRFSDRLRESLHRESLPRGGPCTSSLRHKIHSMQFLCCAYVYFHVVSESSSYTLVAKYIGNMADQEVKNNGKV